MEAVINGLLSDFEKGKMTRRQLIQSLALAAAAAAPVATVGAQTASTIPAATGPAAFKTVWLDHISYAVTDYRKSTAFYRDLMGWEIRNDNGKNQCTMKIGDVGEIIIRNRREDAHCGSIEPNGGVQPMEESELQSGDDDRRENARAPMGLEHRTRRDVAAMIP